MVDHIKATERVDDAVAPQGVSSQCQKVLAKVQEKNKCKSDSSSLKQIWHLDAKEQPIDLAQFSVGVLLWIKRQLIQAILGLIRLFQISLDQGVAAAAILKEFHAAEMEKTLEELQGQMREYGALILSKGIRLVEMESSSFNFMGRWEGMHQALSTIMSATKSFSEKWRSWNLGAIGMESIQLSNQRLVDLPFPIIHLLSF